MGEKSVVLAFQPVREDDVRMKGNSLPDFFKLCLFRGYGTLRAKVWFIGLEERLNGSKDKEIHRQLRVRIESFQAVEDLSEALRKLRISHPISQRTWGRMCSIMLGLDGAGGVTVRGNRVDYQQKFLGRKKGETFLTELLPLPKPGASIWPKIYKALFGFKTLSEYRKAALAVRIPRLRDLIEVRKPEIVICYGVDPSYIGDLFKGVNFTVDRQDKKIKTGEVHAVGTLVLLIPHFAQRGMSFDRAKRIVELIKKHPTVTFPKVMNPVARLSLKQLRRAVEIKEQIIGLEKKLTRYERLA